MALTAAEQQELKQLLELKRLEEIDAARTKGQAEYDNAYAIDEDDNILERTGKMALRPVQQLAYGVAKPVQQMYYGIKDILPGVELTKEDKLRLEEIAGKEGYLSTGGEIVGDLAMFALPASKIGQFTNSIAKSAPNLLTKMLPFLADFGLTVGSEGLKAPVEGRSRSDRMSDTAEGYLSTALGLKTLGAASNVLRPSAAGQKLYEEGVPLTPGQLTGNPIVEGTEETLSALPFVGANVEKMQNNALKSWNTNILNEANPSPNRPIMGSGSDAFKQLQDNFDESYKNAYNKINPDELDFSRISGVMDYAKNVASGNVSNNAVKPTVNAINNAQRELARYIKTNNVNALENADDILRKFSTDDRSANDLIKQVREEVKKNLGESGQALRDIDKQYAKYSILRDSATGTKDPLQSDLVIAPANLTAGMKKSATPNQLAREEGFYQNAAQDATDVFGRTRPGRNILRRSMAGLGTGGAALADPVSTAVGLAGSGLATTEIPRKMITGAINKQAAFADALRSMPQSKDMTLDELNALLRRASGVYEASGDSDGYGN